MNRIRHLFWAELVALALVPLVAPRDAGAASPAIDDIASIEQTAIATGRLRVIGLSPDGSRLAFLENAARYFAAADLWTYDLGVPLSPNLTDDAFDRGLLGFDEDDLPSGPVVDGAIPVWSPDGDRPETVGFRLD